MQTLSPRPSVAAHSSLQHHDDNNDMANSNRPTLMKRQSSASSHNSKHGALSPGSVGEYQPLRHHVKTARKTKIVLPRNHSSGRNLAKMAQQAAQNHHVEFQERKNSKQKSRESDSEIRLPGSLDESRGTLRRNLTSTQLPRNNSHTKLKKNLSHGQLQRLGLEKTTSKGPPSPGLKARNKRPRSADMGNTTKDLHQQEVELAEQQQTQKKDAPKKVGFAIGSSGHESEGEDLPQMEGSGLQEDEWTDQSASASPYSTRQNTANNSRRASMIQDKPPDRQVMPVTVGVQDHENEVSQSTAAQQAAAAAADVAHAEEEGSDTEEDDEDEDEQALPRSMPKTNPSKTAPPIRSEPQTTEPQPAQRRAPSNPATKHLLTRTNQSSPAPALVSNVSALDNTRSGRTSPNLSTRSTQSVLGADGTAEEEDQDELVSRFMPSASHPDPSTASGVNTMTSTPRMGHLYTPEDDKDYKPSSSAPEANFTVGPTSPGSTRSASSSTAATAGATPAGTPGPSFSRWRNEAKLQNEKLVADIQDAAAHQPIVPSHVFDRRNESLKSYLNLASLGGDGRGGLHATTGLSMGPEIFAGRFKAVNTELKVVQRFRDPVAESVARLYQCKGVDFSSVRAKKASPRKAVGKMPITSKSAISLPKQREASKLSTSASPPKSGSLSPAKPAMATVKSATQIRPNEGNNRRAKVSFSGLAPQVKEDDGQDGSWKKAEEIARGWWESAVG